MKKIVLFLVLIFTTALYAENKYIPEDYSPTFTGVLKATFGDFRDDTEKKMKSAGWELIDKNLEYSKYQKNVVLMVIYL